MDTFETEVAEFASICSCRFEVLSSADLARAVQRNSPDLRARKVGALPAHESPASRSPSWGLKLICICSRVHQAGFSVASKTNELWSTRAEKAFRCLVVCRTKGKAGSGFSDGTGSRDDQAVRAGGPGPSKEAGEWPSQGRKESKPLEAPLGFSVSPCLVHPTLPHTPLQRYLAEPPHQGALTQVPIQACAR